MPAFDKLQRASFDGVAFPVEEVDVEGTLRDHVHEYPHTPGGAPEKEGRRLYVVRMVASFLDIWREYPGLWPDGLARVRGKYEAETTGDLLIPTIGTIPAYITNIKQRMSARLRSGEKVELTFREDQSNQFLADALMVETTSSFAGRALALKTEVDLAIAAGVPDVELNAPGGFDLFGAIHDAVNAVLAIRDQADLYGHVLEGKIEWLIGLCEEADRMIAFLQNPLSHRIGDALRSLWDAAHATLGDTQERRSPLRTFTVPVTMAVGDVSRAIYGDGTRAVELLSLNPIDDAFRVPAGTAIKFYPAT
jgi:prophage DNA circulation protein